MKFTGRAQEYIYLNTIDHTSCSVLSDTIENTLTVLWFESNENILNIDGKDIAFQKNEIVFLTEFHQLKPIRIGNIRLLRFNRPFYCVLDHDSEVGCKGILFFGAAQLPVVTIPPEELLKFNTLWEMFIIEIHSNDKLQIDMLQIMLKRYLIMCARLFKEEKKYPDDKNEVDIIREYNFLVEKHFKQKHTVKEYADLLHKSPKTLSNIFSKAGSKSPLLYIKERILLEARRLLLYTEKPIKQIAYELGYDDIQSFSRFFKKLQGVSPSEYKKNPIV
ncbi:AraC family transcriptional regulator [Aquimarina sp. 2201CG5-10]|uniref:helix-turn-helix domain-containing protein n=1 Tax=Aquimarina callyspongiae TaxID=3098150 RepID=UPI002AB3A813|nr:AraC family transcriptional regulator [Aquimarina sp. 2201CG5-10]MDY8138359.1 AraC family transcriptional regulator [Aquimarina sp. 2201CG5-10]